MALNFKIGNWRWKSTYNFVTPATSISPHIFVFLQGGKANAANQISKSLSPIKKLFWVDGSTSLAYVSHQSNQVTTVNVPKLTFVGVETILDKHVKQVCVALL